MVSYIQIYGAGVAGTYLYNLLIQDGFNVAIYDIRSSPDCRCGWGISYSEAKGLYREIGINLDDYVLSKPEYIVINDRIWLKNKEVVMFDKRKLLEELWRDLEFKEISSDIIVDATGFKRAVLPRIERDSIYRTYQTVERHDIDENVYIYMRRTGYAWAFPLGGKRWHIGAGDLTVERAFELIEKLRDLYGIKRVESECSCMGSIRLLPPSKCRPIVYNNVYGVGEAIGCVSGAGEGNAPSLKCAKVFFECLKRDELDIYEKRVLEEFWWIEVEQEFVLAVQENKKLKALRLLPKIVSIESKRSIKQSVRDLKNILRLLR